MAQMGTGDRWKIGDEPLTHPRVDPTTFTGGVAVGKAIVSRRKWR